MGFFFNFLVGAEMISFFGVNGGNDCFNFLLLAYAMELWMREELLVVN